MSRATGYVWDSDGQLVGYAMYDGTSDVMWSRIHPSPEAAWEAYAKSNRKWDPERARWFDGGYEAIFAECNCGLPPANGFIGTDYGHLRHWPATYCLTCRAITSALSFDERWDENEADEWAGSPAPRTLTEGAPPTR